MADLTQCCPFELIGLLDMRPPDERPALPTDTVIVARGRCSCGTDHGLGVSLAKVERTGPHTWWAFEVTPE